MTRFPESAAGSVSGDAAPSREPIEADSDPASETPPSAASDLRHELEVADDAERARLIAQLLQFAPWAEIWRATNRAAVIEIFPRLELPETLRQAWARHLGIADEEAVD